MNENVDWSHGEAHMLEGHKVTVDQANEALDDPDRVLIQPDYNSKSGKSDRVIGYSLSYGDLLSIILARDKSNLYGVNGWRSNPKDRAIYNEGSQS